MNTNALRQAENRLTKLLGSLTALQGATTFRDLEIAWTDFLSAASTIYSKLEQGAKIKPESERWFQGIKHTRRTDQLLRYLHHARNSDEHGIENVARRGGAAIHFWNHKTGEGTEVRYFGENVDVTLTHASENPDYGSTVKDFAEVVRVHDRRFQDYYDPPNQHLGQPITTRDPAEIAELAYNYFIALLAEAATL